MNPNDIGFAIAVPVGRWHPLLPEALNSIAIQSAPCEVAFLDASGDPRVAEAAEASGLTFAYRRDGADAGQAAAIAEGWRNTRAEIVAWLNVDDLLKPGALGHAADAFAADADLAVFHGRSDFIDITGAVIGSHDQVEPAGPLLLRSNTISQPSCFVRRRFMDEVGGLDESLHYTMDWDLWIRLYSAGARFAFTDECLSSVYMGQATKTAALAPRRLREVAALVARHSSRWNAFKSTLSLAGHTLARRESGSDRLLRLRRLNRPRNRSE